MKYTEFIEYGEDKYPFLFSHYAFKEFQKINLDNGVDLPNMTELGCFLGFKYGAEIEKVPCKWTRESLAEAFNADPEFNLKVAEVWGKHFEVQKKIQEKLLGGENPA